MSSSDIEKTAYREMCPVAQRLHSSTIKNEDLERCGEMK
jgi:hypothetical protein